MQFLERPGRQLIDKSTVLPTPKKEISQGIKLTVAIFGRECLISYNGHAQTGATQHATNQYVEQCFHIKITFKIIVNCSSYMPKTDIGKDFNKILKLGDDKIKKFHETRGRIDSFWRIVHALFDKRVYQKCVDELKIAHEDLSAFEIHVSTFYFKNKKYFSGIAKQHLDLYMKYISEAVNVSTNRLILQQLILDIKVNNTMKDYRHDIPSMFDDINKSCEECGQLAKSLNMLSDEIRDTNRTHSSFSN